MKILKIMAKMKCNVKWYWISEIMMKIENGVISNE